MKAKRAAEEARQAAQAAVSRIEAQLIANEIGADLQLVREIDAACREQKWAEAIDRCDEARTRLAICHNNPRLRSDEREHIDSAISYLGDVLFSIQKLRRSKDQKSLSMSKAKQLHEIIAGLGRIQGRLQIETREV